MKSVDAAHRAGARDAQKGLGPTPPRGGAAGSLAQRIRDAYVQSYRDTDVAVRGAKRDQNRRRTAKRVRNPKRFRYGRFVLYAQRRGGPILKYVGRSKFARSGKPIEFDGLAQANLARWVLKDTFREELKHYRLFAK